MHRLVPAILLFVSLAGCLGSGPNPGPDAAAPEPVPPLHLQFSKPVTVTGAHPIVNTGEPVAAFTPDGSIAYTFSGCDRPPAGVGTEEADGEGCYHSPLFRSRDGVAWTRLDDDGRLHPEAPFSGGDTIVDADDLGRLYVLYMDPEGLTLLRSDDDGATWDLLPTPHTGTRDRPWMDVTGEGRIDLTYRVGSELWYARSEDGGQRWGNHSLVASEHTQQSTVRARPGCPPTFAFTAGAPGGVPGFGLGAPYSVHVATLHDDGWEVETLDRSGATARAGTHAGTPMGVLGLDVDEACDPVVAWAQETSDAEGVTEGGRMVLAQRKDGWTFLEVPMGDDVVMPWLRTHAGTHYLVAYARDRVAGVDLPWDLRLAAVAANQTDVRVLDEAVHVGEFCTSNPFCVPTDRSLLDHLFLDLHPVHGVVAAYGAEPAVADVKQMRAVVGRWV